MIRSWVFLVFLGFILSAQNREDELQRLSEQARSSLAAKKWDEAAKALGELARRAPSVAQVHANLGLALYFEGKASEALTAFERARKLDPALPQVNLMIGLCDAELGHYEEAAAILAPAFGHPPDEEIGRLVGLHLARSYTALKQFDRAAAVAEELVQRYPSDAEILYQVSRMHSDRSYTLMADLVRAAPDSAWTHYANGQVQESIERFAAAEQEYRKAIERDPRLAGAHYHLGRVILSISRTPESVRRAQHEFEQELAVSPTNADAEYELGEIEREHGNLEEAIAHFTRAIRYHPQFVEAQVGIAKTLMKLRRNAEAVPHLTEAARLEPENKIPHYLLSSAYKALGDTAAAAKEIALYQKMQTLNPAASSEPAAPDGVLNPR